MYSRQISEPPEKIIKDGKALFGTYSGVSPKIDIKGMKAPYAGIPLPAFVSKLRIKSRLIYTFSFADYIGKTEFFDFKAFGLAEVIFWNKISGRKYAYYSIMPTRRRFVPMDTNKAVCACYKKGRKIKIAWHSGHQNIKMEFRLRGDKNRPSARTILQTFHGDELHRDLMFVSPAPTSSRCTATWLSAMQVKGNFVSYKNGEKIEDIDVAGLAMMVLTRSYYKFFTEQEMVTGIGVCGEKKICFRLVVSNLDAADPDKNNSNTLIVDGETTTLPSVFITHPFGLDKKWIIQDTESMVDLTFTPASRLSRHFNIILMKTSYSTIFGAFDGVLLTSSGEKIVLKNFPGLVYKNKIRT